MRLFKSLGADGFRTERRLHRSPRKIKGGYGPRVDFALLSFRQRGRKRPKGLKLIWFPVSNLRSHQVPLSLTFFHQPPIFKKFPSGNRTLLCSSHCGVTRHAQPDAVGSASLLRWWQGCWRSPPTPPRPSQTQQDRLRRDGPCMHFVSS